MRSIHLDYLSSQLPATPAKLVCVRVGCYICPYINIVALRCYVHFSFCSSQVLKLKGPRPVPCVLSWSCPHPFCCHLDIEAGIRKGRPRTVLPTPSSAGAQDEGVREREGTLPPQPTPEAAGQEVAGCPPGCGESPLSSRSCARREGLGLSVCLLFSWDYTKEEIVGHMVNLCLISEQLSSCLESGFASFYIPISNV